MSAPLLPKPCCTRAVGHPETVHAIERFRNADDAVIGIPVCEAAYTGQFKASLDLQPQCALEGVTVLPLAIGGSTVTPWRSTTGCARCSPPGAPCTPRQLVGAGRARAGRTGGVVKPGVRGALEREADQFSASLGVRVRRQRRERSPRPG
ncbi:NAD(P)H-dependent oxidoreductase [Streptomyces sp. NPDC048489]|uniref:NAD(P)H-dependent oxidoreductase n=1 Tax=Streptomyces sp. NPDC048489 TaxID=3154504 RepID=UPI0034296FD5